MKLEAAPESPLAPVSAFRRWPSVTADGALALLAVLLYAPTLGFGLIGVDESVYYFQNPALAGGSFSGLGALWRSAYFSDYFPITQITLWIDLAVFDPPPWYGPRVHGLIWWILGIWAVRRVIERLSGSYGMGCAVAALFAAHPVCVSSVVWLAQRKNLVCFALSFWCVALYVSGRSSDSPAGLRRMVSAWILLGLALLAKAHAVAVPLVLLILELGLLPGTLRRAFLAWFPFALLGAGFVVLNLAVWRSDLQQPMIGGSLPGAAWSSIPLLASYLYSTVLPLRLSFYYAALEPPLGDPGTWVVLAGVTAAAAFTVWWLRPARRTLCAWLLGFAALLPAINLIPQPVSMADHYHLWALPFWLWVLAAAGGRLAARFGAAREGTAAAILTGGAAAALAGVTLWHAQGFANPGELFARAVLHEPNSSWAHAANARALHGSVLPHMQRMAGPAAWHALRVPDAHRLLPQDRAFAIALACEDLWQRGKPVEAEGLLEREAALIADPWLRAATVAEAALKTRRAARAAEALEPLVTEAFGAQAAVLRRSCRSGAARPDELPPAQLRLQVADAFAHAAVNETARKALFLLARAQVERERLEEAFDAAAVLVNLEPEYVPGRLLLAEIYRRLGVAEAAEALGRTHPKPAAAGRSSDER